MPKKSTSNIKELVRESGISGFSRFGRFVVDDFISELRGRRGMQVYREMRDNDATIGAIVHAIQSMVRTVSFHIESSGTTEKHIKVAKFVEDTFRNMQSSWDMILSDILSFIVYGWSYFEIIYDIDKDGNIVWKDWQIRAQTTLWGWEFDENNNVLGLYQLAPPDFKLRYIPYEKSLLFRHESNRGNPEGRSLLRSAYRAWYIKKNIEDIEALGIEKDMAGVPVIYVPPEIIAAGTSPDATPEEKQLYDSWVKTVSELRRNQRSGIILPAVFDEHGQKLYSIESFGQTGTKHIDTDMIIKRYDRNIAMTLLADFLLLGINSQGSYALSSTKSSLFLRSLRSIIKVITSEINHRAIPKLLELNSIPKEYAPIMKAGRVDEDTILETAQYISSLVSSGIITPDEKLEDYVREIASLPDFWGDSDSDSLSGGDDDNVTANNE